MNKDVRIDNYRKIYAYLKEKKELQDFEYSSEQKELEFTFRFSDFHFEFCLFTNSDRLRIRAIKEIDQPDDEAVSLANTIANNYPGMIGTAYDGKMILESNVFFVGVPDKEASDKIFKETDGFVKSIIDYASKEGSKKDPGTVDNIGMERNSDVTVEEKSEVLPTNVQDSFDTNEKKEDQDAPAEEKADTPKVSLPKDIPDSEEPSLTPGDKAYSKNEGSVSASDDLIDTSADEAGSPKSNGPNIPWFDTLENTIKGKESIVTEDHAKMNRPAGEVPKKSEIVTDLHKEDASKEKTKTSQPVDSTPEKSADTTGKSMQKTADKKADNFEIKVPENVPVNIKKMLESINQTFVMRKEQLDYRDRISAKKKEQLRLLETEINIAKDNIEKQRQQLKQSEEKLKKNWDNYNAAKRNIVLKKESLAKREAEISAIEEELKQKQAEMEELIKGNQLQKEELRLLQNYIAERSAEHEKSVEAFENDKAEFQRKNASMIEKIRQLEEKEEELRIIKEQLDMRENTLNAQYEDMKTAEKMLEEKTSDVTISNSSDIIAELQKENSELRKQLEDNSNMLPPENEQNPERKVAEKAEPSHDTTEKAFNTQMKKECEEAERKYLELQKTHDNDVKELESKIHEKSQQISQLEERNRDAAAKVAEVREQARQLENKVSVLSSENAEMKSKIKEKDIVIDQIKKQNESISMKRDQVIGELKEAGYEMEEMQCEESLLFRGSKDKVTFYVDKSARVLYVEIPAKSKHRKLIMEWNEEDIRFAYSMSKKKATCRCIYDNIVEDLAAILKKFSVIK